VDRASQRTQMELQVPVVQGSLHFARFLEKPGSGYFFSIDDIFDSLYEPFCFDFGPPNFGQIYLFCKAVRDALERFPRTQICFYATEDSKELTNALCLIGAYCIMALDWSSQDTFTRFQDFCNFTVPYRDASAEINVTYGLNIKYCFDGLRKGKDCGWLNLDTFDYFEYSFYERVENGDFNWIVPGKLLAVCSPTSDPIDNQEIVTHPPSLYIEYFKKKGIDTIVRLNKVEYEAQEFVAAGINHYDMYFIDGTSPPLDIVLKFLKVAEQSNAIAVHCKQGLGRTGTLLACYLMKHYDFGAAESIAFLRIQRPGSVVGPQQQFLHQIEGLLKKGQPMTQSLDSSAEKKKRSQSPAVIIPTKATKIQKKRSKKTLRSQWPEF